MSRAFIKEPDGDHQVAEVQPERIHSALPNYITRHGLEQLKRSVKRLEGELTRWETCETLDAKVEAQRCHRDLRYLKERLHRAIAVEVPSTPPDQVRFGVTVALLDENNEHHEFTLVGEDEIDVEAGRISWASPMARLLMDKEVGDTIEWPRGKDSIEAQILGIRVGKPPVTKSRTRSECDC